MEQLKGIEYDRVGDWLARHVRDSEPPYDFELIAAGGSNLTYRVKDGNGFRFVLRRPPVRGVVATAHDMHREWRVMEALGRHTDVPVPETLAYCDDADVTGAPFYTMSFVDGLIIRDRKSAAGLDAEQARIATESLVDVQVAFHTLDIDAVGLGDLGKKGGYVERQLHRWHRQAQAVKTRELPLLEELYQTLSKTVPPEQARPALAHGDYRFDNCVLGSDCRIAAVLDWELCTIGDPIADFFWSLQYWADPGDTGTFLQDPPTVGDQFMRRDDVAELYEEKTGFDISDQNYYFAFGWWKMACIVEGVYARLKQGAGGGMKSAPPEQVAEIVERYLEEAHWLLSEGGE